MECDKITLSQFPSQRDKGVGKLTFIFFLIPFPAQFLSATLIISPAFKEKDMGKKKERKKDRQTDRQKERKDTAVVK